MDYAPELPSPDVALRQLKVHPVLMRLEPLGRRPTYEEWEALAPEERSRLYEPQIAAAQSTSRADLADVEKLIRVLGTARHGPAVPFLAQVWRTCPVTPIRVAAGHALLAIRTAEAVAVLWTTRDDWEQFPAHLAVRARLVNDPTGAVELTEQLVEAAHAGDSSAGRLVDEMLRLLAPWVFAPGGQEKWLEEGAKEWLREDGRWLALCVRLRSDSMFGEAARDVLRYQPRERVEAILAEEPKPPPPTPRPPRARRSWLARYRAGEFEAVWRELTDLGPITEPEIRDEATRVADEMMTRAREAISKLVYRLQALDYPVRPQPSTDAEVETRLRELESVAEGPVPIALASFWRVVVGVDLAPVEDTGWPAWMPTDPRWMGRLDPLVLDRLADGWYSVEEWLEDRAEHLAEVVGPLDVAIAPDALHRSTSAVGRRTRSVFLTRPRIRRSAGSATSPRLFPIYGAPWLREVSRGSLPMRIPRHGGAMWSTVSVRICRPSEFRVSRKLYAVAHRWSESNPTSRATSHQKEL